MDKVNYVPFVLDNVHFFFLLPDVTCLVQGKIQFKDVSTLDARVCRFVAICVTSLLIWHNRGYVFLAEPNCKRLSKEICS